MDLLVLCTGNICRSPMAEALVATEAASRDVAVDTASAGFVTEHRRAEPHAIEVMADRGLDLTSHRSRLLTPAMLARADLVVGMTREHVRRAALVDRDAFGRTFTLKELVRRGQAVGPIRAEELDEWLAVLDEDRSPSDLLGNDDRDDIADPMGRSLRRFRSCAAQIEAEVAELADLLWARGDGRRVRPAP